MTPPFHLLPASVGAPPAKLFRIHAAILKQANARRVAFSCTPDVTTMSLLRKGMSHVATVYRLRCEMDQQWTETLRADVAMLAADAFDSPDAAVSVTSILCDALSAIDRLPRPDPLSPHWRSVALVAQMVVSGIENREDPSMQSAPFERLTRFLRENGDLLEFKRAV